MLRLRYHNWSEVPVGTYHKIKAVMKDSEGMTTMERNAELLAVLCECSVEDVMNAPVSEVNSLLNEIMFVSEKMNIREVKSVTIDGVKYVVNTDFRKVTTAQYVDFQTFYKKFEECYCNVLACFIIPEGHKYNDGYDVVETAKIFEEKLNIEIAESACFFFALRSKRSLMTIFRRTILQMMVTAMKTGDREMVKRAKHMMRMRDDIAGLGR